jgi:hypothetical protein
VASKNHFIPEPPDSLVSVFLSAKPIYAAPKIGRVLAMATTHIFQNIPIDLEHRS